MENRKARHITRIERLLNSKKITAEQRESLISFDRFNELEAQCSLGTRKSYLQTLHDLAVNIPKPFETMTKEDLQRARARRELRLREFPNPQKAEHIKLVKGTYVVNPHIHVLCPVLATAGVCKKKGKGIPHARPKLLLQHHSIPNLQLWQCLGCKDFLLRVEL